MKIKLKTRAGVKKFATRFSEMERVKEEKGWEWKMGTLKGVNVQVPFLSLEHYSLFSISIWTLHSFCCCSTFNLNTLGFNTHSFKFLTLPSISKGVKISLFWKCGRALCLPLSTPFALNIFSLPFNHSKFFFSVFTHFKIFYPHFASLHSKWLAHNHDNKIA